MKELGKKFQGLFDYLKDRGGECIMICRDSSKTMQSCTAFMALTPESTASLMAELFDRYPYLISKALMAAAFYLDDEVAADDGEDAENEGCDLCMN